MMRRPVSLWRGLAALLALLTPLAQQRPALLDGLPMAHAMAMPAPMVAAPAQADAGHAAPAADADCHTHGDPAPASPDALWCCELATVPVVVSPWLAATVATAPIVYTRHLSTAAVPDGTAWPSQTRLPFATAPPTLVA